MNLHGIASPAISVVNPMVLATIKQSTGYSMDADGAQVPAYVTWPDVPVQMQALSNDEIHQVEGLNLQGNKQAVYLNGPQWTGLDRNVGRGGDIFIIGGLTYLVAIVLENWPDWTKLALVQQTVEVDGVETVQFSDQSAVQWDDGSTVDFA